MTISLSETAIPSTMSETIEIDWAAFGAKFRTILENNKETQLRQFAAKLSDEYPVELKAASVPMLLNYLEYTLVNYESEAKTAQRRIKELEKDMLELDKASSAQKEANETSLNDITSKYEGEQKANRHLKADLEKMRKKFEASQQNLLDAQETLTSERREWHEKKSALQVSIDQFNVELVKRQEEFTDYKTALGEAQTEIRKLERSNEDLKLKLEEAEKCSEALLTDMGTQASEYQREKARASDLERALSESKRETEISRKEAARQLDETINRMEEQHEQTVRNIETNAQCQNQRLQAELSENSALARETRERLSLKESELSSRASEINKLRHELADANRTQNEMEKKLREETDEGDVTREEKNYYAELLKQKDNECSDLLAERNNLRAELTDVQRRCETEMGQLVDARRQVHNAAREEWQRDQSSLEEALLNKSADIEELQLTIKHLRKELSSASKRNFSANTESIGSRVVSPSEHSRENERLRTEIAALKAIRRDLEESQAKKQREQNKRIVELLQKVESTERKLAESKSSTLHNREISRFPAIDPIELENLRDRATLAERSAARARDERNVARQERKRLQTSLDKMQIERSNLIDRLNLSLDHCRQWEATAAHLQSIVLNSSHIECDEEIQTLLEEIERLSYENRKTLKRSLSPTIRARTGRSKSAPRSVRTRGSSGKQSNVIRTSSPIRSANELPRGRSRTRSKEKSSETREMMNELERKLDALSRIGKVLRRNKEADKKSRKSRSKSREKTPWK